MISPRKALAANRISVPVVAKLSPLLCGGKLSPQQVPSAPGEAGAIAPAPVTTSAVLQSRTPQITFDSFAFRNASVGSRTGNCVEAGGNIEQHSSMGAIHELAGRSR
jgi:hypothetical protein